MSIGDIVKDIEYSSYYFDIRHNFSIDRDGFPKSWSDHGLSTGHLHPLADPGHDRDPPPHPGWKHLWQQLILFPFTVFFYLSAVLASFNAIIIQGQMQSLK